jgi:UDP-N-acetylglucosamine 1-carboxyvinyltransferase
MPAQRLALVYRVRVSQACSRVGAKAVARIPAALSSTVIRETAAESFVIEGGRPLGGRVRAAGNKNGALPIMAACLLTDEPVVLENVPRIRDIETMGDLLGHLGAEVEWAGRNEVRIHAAELVTQRSTRSSPTGSAPRSCSRARCSRAPAGRASRPGRRRDQGAGSTAHPRVRALGARAAIGERYELRRAARRGRDLLDEASVMATENAVMLATSFRGRRLGTPPRAARP